LTKAELSIFIKAKALEMGFSDCGIIEARNLLEEEIHYQIWINKGYNAGMDFFKVNNDKRFNPKKLVENTKSIISVLYNYYPKNIQSKSRYKISKYALSDDYHKVIKLKLQELLNYINTELKPVSGSVFTDSAPVLEKAVARRAGLGWIGKNSLLLSKKGTFFFIGEIFVDIELFYDKQMKYEYCGSCTKCKDACPTNAIYEDYKVDANRCIAYHTIENKGQIPEEFREKFNNWIYGCDICQDVCPWNSKIEPNVEANQQILDLTDNDFENMDEKKFDEIFAKSAIKRAKFQKFKQNIEFCKK
jgi:epoxyqueuosine reductase